MPSRLVELPREIQTHIFSYLRHADLIRIIPACKTLRAIAEPLVWTHIELHDPGLHEPDLYRHNAVAPNDNQPRRYIEPNADDVKAWSSGSNATFYIRERFFKGRAESLLMGIKLAHAQTLRHVRSICMTFTVFNEFGNSPKDMWMLFSRFPNLLSLDLTVEWPPGGGVDLDEWHITISDLSSLPPLAQLQDLRLQGYFPRAFARWLLLRSNDLQTLKLFLLDRPISGSNGELVNPPPGKGRDHSPTEEAEDDNHEASDSNSDSGTSYDEEGIAPRALSILDPSDTLENLKRVSTLILTRPVQPGDEEPVRELYHSIRCDNLILKEWKRLLHAARSSVKHIVFDQRPCCEDIEQDGTGSDEYMEMYPYGPGHARFKKVVLPVLLPKQKRGDKEKLEAETWPMLESIKFYGFDVPLPLQMDHDDPSESSPWSTKGLDAKQSFFNRVKGRFGPLDVKVESHLGKRITIDECDGEVRGEEALGTPWYIALEDE